MTDLKGVGEKTAKLFAKCGVTTVAELLRYYPRDYDIYGGVCRVADAPVGRLAAVRCAIVGPPALRHVRGMSVLTFQGADPTGQIRFTYFNAPYLQKSLKSGKYYIFRGLLRKRGNTLYMEQAKTYSDEEYAELADTLQPRYALVKGLTNRTVSRTMRLAMDSTAYLTDPLPPHIRQAENFPGYGEAVRRIHFPQTAQDLSAARRRLAFDEFYFFLVRLRSLKREEEASVNAFPCIEVAETKRLIEALPYRLTKAQARIWDEIRTDLSGPHVMNRLIQGDVGSGKTILAFLALLMCAANGYQGAIMAPTAVLARQHFETFLALTKRHRLPLRPVLLTGTLSAKEKRLAQEGIRDGLYNCVVGTNALIQEKVVYKKLALVITDEQHRFGVRQREALTEKADAPEEAVRATKEPSAHLSRPPHVLAMSATPIPRTLAIILYGDLHVSLLDEAPGGRKRVLNCVVGPSYRQTAYQFIAKEVARGRQAYVICPLVEAGDAEGLENVEEYAGRLKSALPPAVRVEKLHGRMRQQEKDRRMEEFAAGNIDVLVATTVIEVGVNVPNATVMMIENAERFGLAQLHQLRGRVGRGTEQSYCIFLTGGNTREAEKRLEIMKTSNNGFEIAEEDLRQRGPGELFGVRQSGDLNFRIADIYRDADLLQKAAAYADE